MDKLIFRNFQSPGDILMLTAAVRDLHLTYPGKFKTDVRTPCPALWENNPYITQLEESDVGVRTIDCSYPLIHRSNSSPYHFIHGFRLFLNDLLKLDIQPHKFGGDIHLREEEKHWLSQVDEVTNTANTRFWIIVSGGKMDFTTKWWDSKRYQAVVDHFRSRIQFVQCGDIATNHWHPPLEGVIDLRGKTDLRQLVRLIYHSDGIVCPITFFMHAAAAIETKPGRPLNRACVVVAGGREPSQWEAYPHHQFLHTNGCLPCCDNGGCWKSRVEPIGDDDPKDQDLCEFPVTVRIGLKIPKCLEMITARDVAEAVSRFLQFDQWRSAHR
jgi:ADP-heptose:LPS heptosyltransferase